MEANHVEAKDYLICVEINLRDEVVQVGCHPSQQKETYLAFGCNGRRIMLWDFSRHHQVYHNHYGPKAFYRIQFQVRLLLMMKTVVMKIMMKVRLLLDIKKGYKKVKLLNLHQKLMMQTKNSSRHDLNID